MIKNRTKFTFLFRANRQIFNAVRICRSHFCMSKIPPLCMWLHFHPIFPCSRCRVDGDGNGRAAERRLGGGSLLFCPTYYWGLFRSLPQKGGRRLFRRRNRPPRDFLFTLFQKGVPPFDSKRSLLGGSQGKPPHSGPCEGTRGGLLLTLFFFLLFFSPSRIIHPFQQRTQFRIPPHLFIIA